MAPLQLADMPDCNISSNLAVGRAARTEPAAGPNTWQRASEARGGGMNFDRRVFGSGGAVRFIADVVSFSPGGRGMGSPD